VDVYGCMICVGILCGCECVALGVYELILS